MIAMIDAKTVTAAAALATALALAGCTSGSAHHTGASASGAGDSSHAGNPTKAPALPSGVTAATNVPTRVPNEPTLRKHVTLSSCKATPGGWGASGTASNPGPSNADYAITVFFTTDHATVIGTAATRVHVAAGGSEQWSVTTKLHAPASTLCVLRGVG
jgi:hypothetical protein